MKQASAAVGIMTVAVFILLAATGWSEESAAVRHWYRLEIQTGDTTYQCLGSSLSDEKEFAKQLLGAEYIVLDDVSYIDTTGTTKGWQEWDPKAFPRLYINPRHVILFNPMKGDPRKAAKAAGVKPK
jgi:hypothetical protein